MIKKLYALLKQGGVKVYLSGKKFGKCTSPYAVVKEEKSQLSATGKALCVYFSVTAVAPIENYGALEETGIKIRKALSASSFKLIESADDEADGDLNGYIRKFTYFAYKKG